MAYKDNTTNTADFTTGVTSSLITHKYKWLGQSIADIYVKYFDGVDTMPPDNTIVDNLETISDDFKAISDALTVGGFAKVRLLIDSNQVLEAHEYLQVHLANGDLYI